MAPDEEKLPREFGKYYLIERIATGGMAELYRAKLYGAGGFEKDLAIKKVLPHLARDTAFIQMFMDEAMITVTLNHGNIVSVLDFGEINSDYYLVMEFVDGVDLQSLIKKSSDIFEPFPAPIAAYLAHEICRGLDYAHRKVGPDGKPLQIVHRDVSPQNILISFEGEVKIVDFGIARAASRLTSTQAGVLKGKVAYMSPEQIMGQEVDGRSDIFAAGIILYEMLTNHRPFEGATPHETMAMITRGVFEKPQRLNSRVPKKLAEVVKKALEKNVKRRFQTAGEMAGDLSSFLHSEGLRPDPATLAAFIPQRLPEARPKTFQPTPIRTIRRDAARNQPAEHPEPARPQPEEQKPAPAAVHGAFPVAAHQPPAVAPAPEPEPSVVVDGEAVSFDMLNLPDYSEPADSKRPTDPTVPAHTGPAPKTIPALAASPAPPPAARAAGPAYPPGLLSAPTRLFSQSEGEKEIDSATPNPPALDPELLAAQTLLLQRAEPEPAAQKPSSTKAPEPAAPAAAAVSAAAPIQPKIVPIRSVSPEFMAAPTRLLATAEKAPEAPAKPAPKQAPAPLAPAAEVSDVALSWMEKPPAEAEPMDSVSDQEERHLLKPKKSLGKALAIGSGLGVVAAVILILLFKGGGEESTVPPGTDKLESIAAPTPEPAPVVDAGLVSAATDPGEAVVDAGLAVAADAAVLLANAGATADAGTEAPDAGTLATVQPDDGGKTAEPPRPNAGQVHKPPRNPEPKVAVVPKVTNPPVAAGTGTLRINSEPFAIVYLADKKIGPTPQMDIKLPAGSHTLTLKNDALGITKKIRVHIEANKVHTVFVDLNEKEQPK